MKESITKSLGAWGERIAARLLQSQGYAILEQNVRTPYGEIDLIASRENVTVFVEVKTRASKTLGPPEISINARKRDHILASVAYYMQQHTQSGTDWRIDVITVQRLGQGHPPTITHFENAIG
ncbi:MAG: YraN family protein [Anaerolineales bacterium]|nr:YraN family protein [Anaerolineales bacterium]